MRALVRRLLPRSLIGQIALVMAAALLAAQAINFGVLFAERQRASHVQIEVPPMARFVTHPKRVLTRDQLLDLSQGRELAAFERSIDNHISRLRRKVEADPRDPKLIKTVWGGGYTLAAEVRRL